MFVEKKSLDLGDVIWWKQSLGETPPIVRRWMGFRRRAGFGTRRQPSSSYSVFFRISLISCLRESPPNKNWSNNKSLTWSIYKFTTLDFRKKKKGWYPDRNSCTHLWAFWSAPRNLPPQKLPPLRNKGWIIGLPSSLYTIRPFQPLFFGETFHALFTVRRLKSSPATPTHEPSRVVRKGFFLNPATFPY